MIGGKQVPFINCLVSKCFRCGIRDVVVLVDNDQFNYDHYYHHLERDFKGICLKRTGGKGTAGDLIDAAIEVRWSTTWLVMNADTVVKVEFEELLKRHEEGRHVNGRHEEPACTVCLTRRVNVPNEGAFPTDSAGVILASREAYDARYHLAPFGSKISFCGSSTGVLVFSRPALFRITEEAYSGGKLETMELSLEKTELPRLICGDNYNPAGLPPHDAIERAIWQNQTDRRRVVAFDNGLDMFFDFGTRQGLRHLAENMEEVAAIYGPALAEVRD